MNAAPSRELLKAIDKKRAEWWEDQRAMKRDDCMAETAGPHEGQPLDRPATVRPPLGVCRPMECNAKNGERSPVVTPDRASRESFAFTDRVAIREERNCHPQNWGMGS